jgi:hypothetical protein
MACPGRSALRALTTLSNLKLWLSRLSGALAILVSWTMLIQGVARERELRQTSFESFVGGETQTCVQWLKPLLCRVRMKRNRPKESK